MAADTRLHLNVFMATTGHHEASWRFPQTQPERTLEIDYYQEIAAIAERGKLDSLFLGDHLTLGRNVRHVAAARLEPLTMLSALAARTEHIGLIATASTSYTEPYNLARLFASLDHISHGRAGWNIVTSWAPDAAGNFGLAEPRSHAKRYELAAEYLEVVTKLWDSWEDGARVIDRAAGVYADVSRIHRAEHAGQAFTVRGALNIPRSPQGYPVLVQAGSSHEGRSFAARYAEAIFTAQQDLAEARDFYSDVKRQVASLGRNPSSVKILPGLSPILGSTEAEARELERQLNELTVPEVGLQHLAARFDGADLSGFPLDGPVPVEALPEPATVQGAQSRSQIILGIVEREPGLTLRGLLRRLAGGRGHGVFVGTPEQFADRIIEWIDSNAADGFNIMPPYLPGGLTDFVDQVVPILQRRGYFRSEYGGTTLRDHYGLSRPANRYASPELQVAQAR